jgi:hypothetical protein
LSSTKAFCIWLSTFYASGMSSALTRPVLRVCRHRS